MVWPHNWKHDPWADAPPWAIALRDELRKTLAVITTKEDKIMSAVTDALDDLEKNTAAIDGAEDSAEAAFTRLAAMIADLKTNTTDPATAARIQAVSTELAARAAKLGVAVGNTPQ